MWSAVHCARAAGYAHRPPGEAPCTPHLPRCRPRRRRAAPTGPREGHPHTATLGAAASSAPAGGQGRATAMLYGWAARGQGCGCVGAGMPLLSRPAPGASFPALPRHCPVLLTPLPSRAPRRTSSCTSAGPTGARATSLCCSSSFSSSLWIRLRQMGVAVGLLGKKCKLVVVGRGPGKKGRAHTKRQVEPGTDRRRLGAARRRGTGPRPPAAPASPCNS